MGDLATNKTLDDDLAHFGAPVVNVTPTDLCVLPDNWLAVKALCTAGNQWQVCPGGVELALDYARADVAWRLADIRLSPTDFDKLQRLERDVVARLRRPDEQRTEFSVTLKV